MEVCVYVSGCIFVGFLICRLVLVVMVLILSYVCYMENWWKKLWYLFCSEKWIVFKMDFILLENDKFLYVLC